MLRGQSRKSNFVLQSPGAKMADFRRQSGKKFTLSGHCRRTVPKPN